MENKKLITAVTEEEIKAAIVAKANEYKEIYNGEKLVIIAELSGVFVFLADFIRELPLAIAIQFVKFDNKHMEKTNNIKLDLETKTSLQDQNVLIITDIYNHGNTLKRLYEVVSEGQPKNVRVLALANRHSSLKNKEIVVESLFDLEDKKIVGYGMANHENFRGLKSLYYLEESDVATNEE